MFYWVGEFLMGFIVWVSSYCVLLGGGVPNGFYCVGELLMCFIVWVSS